MKKDYSYGIIPVYHKIAEVGDYYFLLVKNCNNSWSFPKGHAEAGETEEETAQRELFEETGVGAVRLSLALLLAIATPMTQLTHTIQTVKCLIKQ